MLVLCACVVNSMDTGDWKILRNSLSKAAAGGRGVRFNRQCCSAFVWFFFKLFVAVLWGGGWRERRKGICSLGSSVNEFCVTINLNSRTTRQFLLIKQKDLSHWFPCKQEQTVSRYGRMEDSCPVFVYQMLRHPQQMASLWAFGCFI